MRRAMVAGLFFLTLVSGGGLAASPAGAVPANDNLANATAITAPSHSGMVAYVSTAGATTQASENSPCGGIAPTVWYSWTSPGTPGSVTFETMGSDYDTVLAIYTGASFPLSPVSCSDDALPDKTSAITLSYAAGTTYLIQVGGYFGAEGNAALYMAPGAIIVVANTSDSNTAADDTISLREAILLARGGTGATGINRSLGGNEPFWVFNAGAAGASGYDIVHFSPYWFPPGAPDTILVPTGASAGLPTLDSTGDTISGVGAGVIVDGQGTTVHDCVVVTGNYNRIEGLQVRRCVGAMTGIRVLGGDSNTIGGAITPQQRNVVRENGLGISIDTSATGNIIRGNYIGTDRTGTIAMGNTDAGVYVFGDSDGNVIGGAAANEGNVISNSGPGSNGPGIWLRNGVNATLVYGNRIGTDVTGSAAMPNGVGILIEQNSALNVIGGASPGQGNVIAYSVQAGVKVDGVLNASQNSVRANSIHSNGFLGVDLVSGGNAGLPAPTIANVVGGVVTGFTCSLCTVDVFNDTTDEGRVFVGTGAAALGGQFSIGGVAHALANITVTVTDSAGNTSEFSTPFAAATNSDGDGLADLFDACPQAAEDLDGWEDGDACPDADNDGDGICDDGQTSASCTGSDVGKYVWSNSTPGTTDCRNVAEDYDSFHDTDGCPEPDNDVDGFPDTSDQCPASDYTAGNDGVADTGDAGEPLNTITSVPIKTREDFDGVVDSDGCHDSPEDDYDLDSGGILDGSGLPMFRDEREALFLGTDPVRACAATPAANDEAGPDAWPFDFNDDQKAALSDVLRYIPVFNSFAPGPPYNARYDLNASGGITLGDVLLFIRVFNQDCVP